MVYVLGSNGEECSRVGRYLYEKERSLGWGPSDSTGVKKFTGEVVKRVRLPFTSYEAVVTNLLTVPWNERKTLTALLVSSEKRSSYPVQRILDHSNYARINEHGEHTGRE